MEEFDSSVEPSEVNEQSFLAGSDGAFAPDWYSKAPEGYSVPDGLKTAPDFWSLVKMTENAQRKLGYPSESLLIKPGKDWKEEQWDEFFDKAGRPKDPAGYEIEAPKEYDAAMVDGFKQVAHKAGLLPQQVKQVFEYYQTVQQKSGQQLQAMQEQALQQAQQELETEWGGQYDQNIESAKKFVNTFADDRDKEALSGDLGNNPAVIRILANAAKVMRDDALIGTNPDSDPNSGSLSHELDEIMKNPVYYDPEQSRVHRAEHDRLVHRAYRIRTQLNR